MSGCNYEPYRLADDCPHCGQKDQPNAWKGARMGNTSWNHSYSCCSDECGKAFLNTPKYKELERLRINGKIASLKRELVALEAVMENPK